MLCCGSFAVCARDCPGEVASRDVHPRAGRTRRHDRTRQGTYRPSTRAIAAVQERASTDIF